MIRKTREVVDYVLPGLVVVLSGLVKGQVGASLSKIVVSMLLGFVGLMFLMYFIPELEDGISSANVTNSFVAALMDMGIWLLPIGGIIGIFYGVFRLFRSND